MNNPNRKHSINHPFYKKNCCICHQQTEDEYQYIASDDRLIFNKPQNEDEDIHWAEQIFRSETKNL